jgi:hypothetical protein
MTPTPADNPATVDSYVTTAPGGLGFGEAVYHDNLTVDPSSWTTWGQGYTGDVYDTTGGSTPSATSLTITLPANVLAFDFYAEPAEFALFDITATAQDGTTLTEDNVNGDAGSSGFGFYGTSSDYITSVTVTATDPLGFAVGEFAMDLDTGGPSGGTVPDTGSTLVFATLALLGLHTFGRYFGNQKLDGAA